jgi:hypothetical protein
LRWQIYNLRQVDPVEHNPRIWSSWPQGEFDSSAGVQANPSGFYELFDRALAKHIVRLVS